MIARWLPLGWPARPLCLTLSLPEAKNRNTAVIPRYSGENTKFINFYSRHNSYFSALPTWLQVLKQLAVCSYCSVKAMLVPDAQIFKPATEAWRCTQSCDLDLWINVNACRLSTRGPTLQYMCTKFGVDSLIRFFYRPSADTYTDTDAHTCTRRHTRVQRHSTHARRLLPACTRTDKTNNRPHWQEHYSE